MHARKYHAMVTNLVSSTVSASYGLPMELSGASSQSIGAVVQEITPALRYISDRLADLRMMHSTYPSLARFHHTVDGSLHLTFSDINTASRLRVILHKGEAA